MSTELARRQHGELEVIEGGGLAELARMSDQEFTTRLQHLRKGQERMRTIQKEILVKDEDYGEIPGTDKPALLKPGAEKLCQFYRVVPTFEDEITIGDGISAPNLRIITPCHLHLGTKDGPIVGEGIGAANSWERKHRYRYADRVCPECGHAGAILKSRNEGEGWFCWDRRGGCRAQFAADDPRILDQELGQIQNPDPYDQENTLLKMARKRAQVDAVLRYTATSGMFTQDVEDDPGETAGKASSAKPVTKPAAGSSQPAKPAPDGVTTITEIKVTSGEKDGKPWTRYDLLFADGRRASTFSASDARHAENAEKANALVKPKLKKSERGGWNLTGFDKLEPASATEPTKAKEDVPDATKDEPVSGPEKILTSRQMGSEDDPRWVIQTDKRQLVTDREDLAVEAITARKDGRGLIPVMEIIDGKQGGKLAKLLAWQAPEGPAEGAQAASGSATGPAAVREPGQEG